MTRAEFIQKIVAETNSERVDVDINYAVQRADALEKSGAAPWDDAPGKTYKQGLADGNTEGLALGQKDSLRWIADEREACAKVADFIATGLAGRSFITPSGLDAEPEALAEVAQEIARVIRVRSTT